MKKTTKEILDTLFDALGDSEGMSLDEIKKELEDEGIDVEATLERFKKFREEISEKAKTYL